MLWLGVNVFLTLLHFTWQLYENTTIIYSNLVCFAYYDCQSNMASIALRMSTMGCIVDKVCRVLCLIFQMINLICIQLWDTACTLGYACITWCSGSRSIRHIRSLSLCWACLVACWLFKASGNFLPECIYHHPGICSYLFTFFLVIYVLYYPLVCTFNFEVDTLWLWPFHLLKEITACLMGSHLNLWLMSISLMIWLLIGLKLRIFYSHITRSFGAISRRGRGCGFNVLQSNFYWFLIYS